MATKMMALLLGVLLFFSCSQQKPGEIDPNVPLDPAQVYVVEYWDAEPPVALDPQRQYRPAVEQLAANFTIMNPEILVRIRWLDWVEAENELTQALQEGNPPDIFVDWQGIARRDHVLQVPAGIWLQADSLNDGGKKLAAHEGKLWAWPRWLCPLGLIAAGDGKIIQGLRELMEINWGWSQLSRWLQEQELTFIISDWDGEFTAQALLAATGYGWGHWGGQELNEVFAGLEILVQQGLITSGSILPATEGAVIGGLGPAFRGWLANECPNTEVILIPLPSAGPVRYIPITGTNLIQFRRLRSRGDDQCRAAAMVAEYLAREQGAQLAPMFLGVTAWDLEALDGGELSSWHQQMLLEAIDWGIPNRANDWTGRCWEQERRQEAAPCLAKFWAGEIGAEELAKVFEGFQ